MVDPSEESAIARSVSGAMLHNTPTHHHTSFVGSQVAASRTPPFASAEKRSSNLKIPEAHYFRISFAQNGGSMFRNWHNTLFLGPMPGTEAPLQEWLDELDEAGITAIVCLNPEDEISLVSHEYHDWRLYRPLHPELKRFDVPVDDGCAPTGAVEQQFWNVATEIARRCRQGDRTFIHCTAGRGRTGMFGVAVLITLGYSIVDAATQLYEVGSYPETDQQDAFLASSLP
jgi:hypothetical protein